jgi:hypothetical protein
MGGGMQVYVLRPAQKDRPDLVGTLDDAPAGQIATVSEQLASAEAWLNDRRQR